VTISGGLDWCSFFDRVAPALAADRPDSVEDMEACSFCKKASLQLVFLIARSSGSVARDRCLAVFLRPCIARRPALSSVDTGWDTMRPAAPGSYDLRWCAAFDRCTTKSDLKRDSTFSASKEDTLILSCTRSLKQADASWLILTASELIVLVVCRRPGAWVRGHLPGHRGEAS
jgi:hypothetical protein